MTWTEFKAEVDRQLAEQGHTGDVKLDYIDITQQDIAQAGVEVTTDQYGLSIY